MSLSWPALSPRRISHRRGPTKKTPGTVNHRVDIAGGTAGNDGQWRNMCRHWELNPSYQWQARVSAEAHNRWHLTPVNSRSADIPLVSASLPIRIDCSTALLIHGVIAESSSSLTLIMSCIDLTTAVCYSEAISSPCSQLMPWCYRSYTGNTCKYGQKYGVHPGRASESEVKCFSPFTWLVIRRRVPAIESGLAQSFFLLKEVFCSHCQGSDS